MHKQLHILFILLLVSSLFTTVYADEPIDNNTKVDELEEKEESVSEEIIKYEEITEDELNEFLQEFYVALNNKNNIKMKELLDKPLDIQEFDDTGNLVDYTILEKRKGDKNDYFVKTTLYFKDTSGNLYESSQYIYVYKEKGKIKISFDKFYENVIVCQMETVGPRNLHHQNAANPDDIGPFNDNQTRWNEPCLVLPRSWKQKH